MKLQPLLLLPFGLLIGFSAAISLHAQEPAGEDDAAEKTAQQLIQEAYEAGKNADTFEQYDELVQLCDAALDKGPNDAGRAYLMTLSAWALNRRGKELSNQASTAADAETAAALEARAMADFQEALKRDPDKWQALHNRGVSYALLGEFDKALADFNRTLNLNPKYPNAWFNRGEIYYADGQYAEAVSDYSQAIRLTPDDAGAYAARAHAQFRQGRNQSAISDFTKAIEIDPEDAVAISDRGDVYAHLGFWQQASRDYRAAIAADDAFGRAYMGAAWIMATCPDGRLRDTEAALEYANKAIELDGGEDWHYLDTLAAAQANAMQFEQAQETLKKALTQAPPDQTKSLRVRLNLYADEKPYRDRARGQ